MRCPRYDPAAEGLLLGHGRDVICAFKALRRPHAARGTRVRRTPVRGVLNPPMPTLSRSISPNRLRFRRCRQSNWNRDDRASGNDRCGRSGRQYKVALETLVQDAGTAWKRKLHRFGAPWSSVRYFARTSRSTPTRSSRSWPALLPPTGRAPLSMCGVPGLARAVLYRCRHDAPLPRQE